MIGYELLTILNPGTADLPSWFALITLDLLPLSRSFGLKRKTHDEIMSPFKPGLIEF